MSLILAQTQGRTAARHALKGAIPNLCRFSVEPSKLHSFGVCANLRNQSESGLSRFASLYHAVTPVMAGIAPAAASFRLSFKYINSVAKKHPLKFGFATACTKAVLADIVAQKVIEGKAELDYRRTGLFFAFGAVYSGVICNALYSWIYPMVFRSRFHKLNAIGSAFADNFINTPFIMFPTLYALKECFLVPGGSLKSAFNKYKVEIKEACITGWKIWIPAHVVTFGIMPTYLRLPYVSCVSFFFFTIISLQQNVFDKRRQLANS